MEFSFDPETATFTRSGSDLVITADNGAGLTLSGFFVAENAEALPTFVLPGGDSVPAAGYLQSLNIDISTAAGPSAAPPSSGEGEYDDGAGSLVGGLDRLGSLGTDQWSRSTSVAEAVNADRIATAGLSAVDGGTGNVPNPPDLLVFDARAVLYMQNESAEPYTDRGVTVQALTKNNGQWEAAGQDALDIQALPGNTLDVDALIERVEDGSGNITFRLTAAGKDWMDAHAGQDIVGYYAITDANGYMYTLQVVISADERFDSSSEHNGHVSPLGLIHGEWHDGKDLSQETGYKTTSSNLSDDLHYTGKLTGAEINTGYADDKNWGNDSVGIEGAVHRSTITSGAGDDSIVISGGGEYDRSVGGEFASTAWSDRAWSPRSKEEAGGATVWGGTIDAGDGNNTIQISGGAMYGIMETAITTGDGDDLIEISGGSTHDRMLDEYGRYAYFGGNAVKDSVINAGDGNNTITITSDYPFNPWVSSNDTIGGYSMAAVNNSKIITGSGNDSITINAATFTFNPPYEVIRDNALYATTIVAGAGSDTVTINGEIDWNSVIALGNTTDRADTDAGQKDDVNILTLNSGQVWKSSIYGSAGKDIITGGSQFAGMTIATGAGSDSITTYGHVQDSTIALGNTLDRADTDAGQKNDVNSLKIGTWVDRSSIYGTAGRDNITIGRDVYGATIATGAGSDSVSIDSKLEASTVALGNTTDQADTDAEQKNDVNTLRVGDVFGSKVYGSAGTELITIDGGVNGSTIDTGSGAGDRVDIRGKVFSTNATDNNLIKAVDGSIIVTAQGAGAQAVSADGANARNTIIGNSVDITATGTTTAYGLYAKGAGASNNVAGGDLNVTATGPSAYGVYAEGAGASTTVNMSGDVNITATGGTVGRGIYATGGSQVDVAANNMTITTESAANSVGMHAASNSNISVHSRGGTVDIKAIGLQGYNGYGMMGENKGTTLIEDAQTVNITVNQDAMCALSGGSNTIKGSGAAGSEVNIHTKASGMYGTGGNASNTITGMETVHIGDEDNRVSLGMSAYTAQNLIDGAKTVDIHATGNAMTAGAYAGTTAGNTISADSVTLDAAGSSIGRGMNASDNNRVFNTINAEDVTIKAAGTTAGYGMAAGSLAENTINAGSVNITASNTANAYGMQAVTEGKNIINADSSVKITAAGTSEGRGMAAGGQIKGVGNYNHFQGSNTINADAGADVSINASGSSVSIGMDAVNKGTNTVSSAGGAVSVTARGGESYGMSTSGGDTTSDPVQSANLIQGASKVTVAADSIGMSANRGTNTIQNIDGTAGRTAVSVTADGASVDGRTGMYAANHHGNSFDTVSENRIEDVTGNVAVTASGVGGSNAAMNVYTLAQASGTGSAKNIITGVDGDVAISALDGDTNYAMRAFTASGSNPAENVIDDVSGKVILKAVGGTEAHGMSASGQSASNTISNAGGVEITAHGADDSYAVRADANGTNRLTASGDVAVTATVTGVTMATGAAHGVSARGAGSLNSITATGDLTVTAAGAPAPGMNNSNPLGRGGIGVVGEGTHDSLARNELTSLEGDLKISGSNYGVYNTNADMVLEATKGNVEITGGSYGVVWLERSWGSSPSVESELSISAGTDVAIKGQRGLVLTDAARYGGGPHAVQDGAATVHAGRDLSIAGAGGGIGIEYLQSGAAKPLELSAGRDLNIEATGKAVARGIYSYSSSGDEASIAVEAGRDLSITAHTTGGDGGYFLDFQMSQAVSNQEGAVGVMLFGGSSTFKAGNDLTIRATDESGTASYAVQNWGRKAIFEAGDTATFSAEGGKNSSGLSTVGGDADFSTGQGPFNTLTKIAAQTADISASGTENAYGAFTQGVDSRDYAQMPGRQYGSAATEIHATGTATVTAESAGNAYALYTRSGNASSNPTHQGASALTTVTGENVTLTATGGDGAYGIHTEAKRADAVTTITASETAAVKAAGGDALAVYATGPGAKNFIESKNVDITASSNASWSQYEKGAVGMFARDEAANSVKADGNVNIFASGGSSASGVNAQMGGANSITASGDVDISATGGRSNYGMIYTGVGYGVSPQLANTVTADGDVRIKASGGFSNTGMRAAYFGANEIAKAASVTVTAEGAGAGLNAAMDADGGFARDAGAFNSIHDVAGAVKLIARDAVGEVSLAFREGSIGMLAVNGAQNFIYNAGSVDIQAESPDDGVATYGMKATGSSYPPSHPAMNHIHDIDGAVSISAAGGKDAYGMAAEGGVNRIENTGGVDITATGVENSYAMHALGGTNIISNNLTVIIKAESGSFSNYAMYAESNGVNKIIGGDGNNFISLKGDIYADEQTYQFNSQNIIQTGAGDDRILLDGKVTGNFILDAGDGYDILVLRAANWDEFTARYETWLMSAAAGGMNIESIQYVVDNGDPMPAGYWLEGVAQGCDAEFGRAEFTDFAHLTGGDVAGYVTHEGDLTATDTAGHTGQAVFGDADDYAHVKGHVENVDINLGDGHNTLHVDGHIKGDVSGGDHGNDIRAGGSFDGHMDLGSGADHVELGAMHSGTVNLGAGDDRMVLHGFTGGTVDGGTGNDTLQLKLDGQGGNSAFSEGGAFSGLFAQGAVRNFEELHFDLSGGSSDSLDVDGLVDSLRGLTIGQQLIVRISGDAEVDHVDTQALESSGWTSHVDANTGYTEWTNTNAQDENLIILIQNGLR